jgi:hypothetical protein
VESEDNLWKALRDTFVTPLTLLGTGLGDVQGEGAVFSFGTVSMGAPQRLPRMQYWVGEVRFGRASVR